MSKYGELKMIRYGRSIDAPINYHHRTGDLEDSGGSILDFYAQEDSAEEVYLDGEDELAKTRFLKGFSGYLRKVFSRQEREFLSRLMSGEEQPREVARALGVDWFKYMQVLQRKAYKNVKPLLKLSELTGWSRAEEFTAMIMRRLALLEDGADLEDILPKSLNRAKVREEIKGAGALVKAEKRTAHNLIALRYRRQHKEEIRACLAAYRAKNKEKIKARKAEYQEKNKEKIKAYRATYDAKNKEKLKARAAEYREKNKEKIKARKAEYREKNKEKLKARKAEYQEKNKEKIKARRAAYREKNKEKIKVYRAAYDSKNKEKLKARAAEYREKNKEKKKAYYEKNKEKMKACFAAYQVKNKEKIKARKAAAYARKKAEREAAKLAAQAAHV